MFCARTQTHPLPDPRASALYGEPLKGLPFCLRLSVYVAEHKQATKVFLINQPLCVASAYEFNGALSAQNEMMFAPLGYPSSQSCQSEQPGKRDVLPIVLGDIWYTRLMMFPVRKSMLGSTLCYPGPTVPTVDPRFRARVVRSFAPVVGDVRALVGYVNGKQVWHFAVWPG